MNSEKEIIALKEEQRMALASNAMECLHQNLCDAGCSKEQIKLCKADARCYTRIRRTSHIPFGN